MDNYNQQGYNPQGYNQQPGYQQPYNPQGYDQQGYQQPGYNQGYPQGPVPEKPAMGFAEAISTCFHKYCCFSGRATRAEYWWWILFTFIVGLVAGLISGIIPFFDKIVSLALFLPGLGVAWRRLHDIGKAGGWYFFPTIPVVIFVIFCALTVAASIGYREPSIVMIILTVITGIAALACGIVYLVWMCKPSEPFDNRFGPYEG